MKRYIQFNKKLFTLTAATCMFLLFTLAGTLQAAEPLKDSQDPVLISLTTELHDAVYLVNSEVKTYGDVPRTIYIDDTKSISLLAQLSRDSIESVELIQIRIKSATDESAKITANQLTKFENLKYVLVLYEFDPCDGYDNCLAQKADKIVALPEESPVELFYILSIPQ